MTDPPSVGWFGENDQRQQRKKDDERIRLRTGESKEISDPSMNSKHADNGLVIANNLLCQNRNFLLILR